MRLLLTVSAAALASLPSSAWGAPEKAEVDRGMAALERLSDSQRAHVEALARACGARPEDVALLRQNGYTWDDAAQAGALAAGWDLELSLLAAANSAGHSWEDIHEAAKLSRWSGHPFATVLALRARGLSWNEVAAEVKVSGMDLRDAPRDPTPTKKKAAPKRKARPAPPKQKAPG